MIKRIVSIICIIAVCAAGIGIYVVMSGGNVSEKPDTLSQQPLPDPYATENDYREDIFFHQKHWWVDYGTVLKDVSYYSHIARENKRCNILLPANYDAKKAYPVLYLFHGFHGQPADHIDEHSYLTILYGNLLYKGLAKEMIIVSADMYTAKLADKEKKTQEQLRFIYDKCVDDLKLDLMPYIQAHYSIKTGKENTAVAGISEGGAEALFAGFKWLGEFGYIGSFAPNPGVIHTKDYVGTYWDKTVFEQFPQPQPGEELLYLYMSVGNKDPHSVNVTREYQKALDEIGVQNQTDFVKGFGHDMLFWKACFYNYLQKIF